MKGINRLLEQFMVDRLENMLPPATVVIQKGRPKNTKREKMGIEHIDDQIEKEGASTNKKKGSNLENRISKRQKVTKEIPISANLC